MMRVCVFGNSHTTCLALAMRDPELRRRSQLTVTFFAARYPQLFEFELKGGTFAPSNTALQERWRATSGGDGVVRLAEYDAFVICGADRSVYAAIDVYHTHQTFRHMARSSASLISEPAFRSIVTTAHLSSAAAYLAKLLKQAQKPVILVPSPMPSEEFTHAAAAAWVRKARMEEPLRWFSLIAREDHQLLASREGIVLVAQPEHTLAPSGLTRTSFAYGSRDRRSTCGARYDCLHASEAYGALIWDLIASRLRDKLAVREGASDCGPRSEQSSLQ